MSPRACAWVGLCLLIAAVSGAGCDACGSHASLAELVETRGEPVERDFAASVGKWQRAELGAQFQLGDGIRVGAKARATLRLADGSIARLRPGSEVRFLGATAEAPGAGIDVRMGEAEIEVGEADLQLGTPLGLAVLRARSRVTLGRAEGERILVRVELGVALLQSESGEVREVKQGQSVEIGIGMAMFEPIEPALPPPPPAAPHAPVAPDVGTPPSVEAVVDAGVAVPQAAPSAEAAALPPVGPAHSSLQGLLGESFTVHSTRVPIAVSFGVGERCPGEAVLIVDRRRRTRGKSQASALLGAGTHPYELRCLGADASEGESLASGTVTVLRDPGTARLPVRAASATIDTDGKRYTVVYQNILPRIVVSWPNAPAATSYSLRVDSSGGQRKHIDLTLKQSSFAFAPGALREGQHVIVFADAEGKRSKPTTLEIRYDNAAPKASVSAPREKGFAVGDSVQVEGVALPGSKVSVVGGELALDGQSRFAGTVQTSAAQPDVALRIHSPHGGVHYYVRRAAGAAP